MGIDENRLGLDKTQRKIIDGAQVLRMRSALEAGAIGYMPTMLINGCMPQKSIQDRIFERENGKFKITFADIHNAGLPYGSLPRLIMVWIATEAILTRSRRINFDQSLAGFLRLLSMTSTGGKKGSIPRLKKQFVSLMSCSIGYEIRTDCSHQIETLSITNKQFYCWSDLASEQQLFKRSYIELSKDFYEHIIASSAPVDTRALNLLRGSPFAMDIYTWLTYKMSTIKKPTEISWAQLRLQIGTGYAGDKKGLNRFQQAFKKWLKYVQIIYPEANIKLIRGRVKLYPGKPHVPQRG